MKKYIIYGCGLKVFICKEVVTEHKMVLLIGKFEGEGKKYQFIKNKKDTEIIN